MAPQFKATKGPKARGLAAWIPWAKSSLPVPDSPVKSTVDGSEALRARLKACMSPTLRPTTRSRPGRLPAGGNASDVQPDLLPMGRALGLMTATTVPTQFPFSEYMGVARAMRRGLARQLMGMVVGGPPLVPGQERPVVEKLLGWVPLETASRHTEQGLGREIGVGNIALGVDGQHAGQHGIEGRRNQEQDRCSSSAQCC